MKAFYLLFVIFIDAEGFETMHVVNDTQYKTKLDCMADKVHYKNIENHIHFFCGEDHLYFNKQQKLF